MAAMQPLCKQTVRYSRQGVMPRWGDKLDPATIKMLAAYVHSLGGGEATGCSGTNCRHTGGCSDGGEIGPWPI
jgi:hypothetical protein